MTGELSTGLGDAVKASEEKNSDNAAGTAATPPDSTHNPPSIGGTTEPSAPQEEGASVDVLEESKTSETQEKSTSDQGEGKGSAENTPQAKTEEPVRAVPESEAPAGEGAVPMDCDKEVPKVPDKLEDYFVIDLSRKRKQGSKSKSRKKKRTQIAIAIQSKASETTDQASPGADRLPGDSSGLYSPPPSPSAVVYQMMAAYDDDEELDAEMEDTLNFLQDTHEEQDPAFVSYQKQARKVELQKKLNELDAQDRKDRKEIDEFIGAQVKQRQASTEAGLQKYKLRAVSDQKRDLDRLQQIYQQKTASNLKKINQGVEMLRSRHTNELRNIQQRHRQQAQQRRLPPDVANAEFQAASNQIKAKQQRQISEFTRKGEEVTKKTEIDYKREQEKIRKTCEQRLAEIENNRQKIYMKLKTGFQQVRQRYLKRHLQRIMRKKNECIVEIQKLDETAPGMRRSGAGEEKNDTVSSDGTGTPSSLISQADAGDKDSKIEFQQPIPVKSRLAWAEESAKERAGASARHKHRKAVMNQTSRQLSVELHNEGLWVSVVTVTPSNSGDDGKTPTSDANGGNGPGKSVEQEFIAWGTRAHSVLESIVCGEIPQNYERFNFGDALSLQGSQIRCSLTDLRTSDSSASAQRAASLREMEEAVLAELEKKATALHTMAVEAEAAAKRAAEEDNNATTAYEKTALDLEKAKRMHADFMNKFRNYIGPDGDVVQTMNANDRQKLKEALISYKSNLENATRREKAAQTAVAEIKARLQKHQAMAKTAQKNSAVVTGVLKRKKTLFEQSKSTGGKSPEGEVLATRVKDVIAALRKAADKRRENLSDKKTSATWVQAYPSLPTALKKSLWHKMHRRKQQIVLRPAPEIMLNGLRTHVVDALTMKSGTRTAVAQHLLDEELLKAEQLFLLATHPFAKDDPPSIPVAKSGEAWAEPGWLINLDIPRNTVSESSILPCFPTFPVFEKNLSEISSAPGRQAASLLRTSHFRCFSSPLSAVAVASSPAEAASVFTNVEGTQADGDPLSVSEKTFSVGYTFSLKPQTRGSISRQSSVSRRKSATKDNSSVTGQPSTSKKVPSTPKEAQKKVVEVGSSVNSNMHVSTERRKSEQQKKRRPSKTTVDTTLKSRHDFPPLATTEVAPKPSPITARNNENQAALAAAAAAAAAQYNPFIQQQKQQQPQQQPQQQQQQQKLQSQQRSLAQSSSRQGQPSTPSQQQSQQSSHHHQFVHQQSQQRRPSQPSVPPSQGQYTNAQQQQQRMAQLRMMQQQQSPHRPQIVTNFPPNLGPPPPGMQMQQFYAPHPPLGHANNPSGGMPRAGSGQFMGHPNISPMHSMQRPSMTPVQPPNAPPPNQQQQHQQQQPQHPQQQQQQQQQNNQSQSNNDSRYMM